MALQLAALVLGLPEGASVDDYVEAIEYTIDLIGEEQVGLGTDLTQDQPPAVFDWINRDKVDGRKLELEGYRRASEFPNITAAMKRRGWTEARIERVLGLNGVGFLREVWGA